MARHRQVTREMLSGFPTEDMTVRDLISMGYRAGMSAAFEAVTGHTFNEFPASLILRVDSYAKDFSVAVSPAFVGNMDEVVTKAYVAPDNLSDKVSDGSVSMEDAVQRIVKIMREKVENG